MLAEYRTQTTQAEKLGLLEGKSLSLYLLLDLRTWPDGEGLLLTVSEVKYLEADLFNILGDCYGSEYRDSYFQELGDIPETVALQREPNSDITEC